MSLLMLIATAVLSSSNAFLVVSPPALPGVTRNQESRWSSSRKRTPSSYVSSRFVQGNRIGDSAQEDVVVIDKDFRLAGLFLTVGIILDRIPWIQLTLGPLVTLLGILFLVQTFRVRFVCDSSGFALENTTKESGENIIVGGENRWAYPSFVNYEFFPKGWIDSPLSFVLPPILVYFKETQTPKEMWEQSIGEKANSAEALANGAKPGQVHFLPALCNCKQLRSEWERRGCSKL